MTSSRTLTDTDTDTGIEERQEAVASRPEAQAGKDKPGLWQPVFAHSGFHSDPYLLKLVDSLVPSVTTFVETGTEAGSTIGYMGRIYPWLDCWSCESHPEIAKIAEHNLQNHNQSRVHVVNRPSVEFLQMIANQFRIDKEPTIFWLDAHSHGGGCPVRGEVDFILHFWKSGWILIDDFKVPRNPKFGFDTYEDGELGATSRMMGLQRPIYYPDYDPPFGARGWCMIPIHDGAEFKYGDSQFPIPVR